MAIFSVVLIVFSVDAISWYKDCQYYYIQSNGTTGTNDCSSKDKSTGNDLYVALLVMVAIVLPISVATVIFSVMNNIVLFDDCCDGGCFRGLIYKFKGGGNTAVCSFIASLFLSFYFIFIYLFFSRLFVRSSVCVNYSQNKCCSFGLQ